MPTLGNDLYNLCILQNLFGDKHVHIRASGKRHCERFDEGTQTTGFNFDTEAREEALKKFQVRSIEMGVCSVCKSSANGEKGIACVMPLTLNVPKFSSIIS